LLYENQHIGCLQFRLFNEVRSCTNDWFDLSKILMGIDEWEAARIAGPAPLPCYAKQAKPN